MLSSVSEGDLFIFKIFTEFVTLLLLLFMFWFFGHKSHGI